MQPEQGIFVSMGVAISVMLVIFTAVLASVGWWMKLMIVRDRKAQDEKFANVEKSVEDCNKRSTKIEEHADERMTEIEKAAANRMNSIEKNYIARFEEIKDTINSKVGDVLSAIAEFRVYVAGTMLTKTEHAAIEKLFNKT